MVAGGEVVDDIDGVTLGEQSIHEVRADESGAAGDEHLHVCVLQCGGQAQVSDEGATDPDSLVPAATSWWHPTTERSGTRHDALIFAPIPTIEPSITT